MFAGAAALPALKITRLRVSVWPGTAVVGPVTPLTTRSAVGGPTFTATAVERLLVSSSSTTVLSGSALAIRK